MKKKRDTSKINLTVAKNILVISLIVTFVSFFATYLTKVYKADGSEKFIYTLILFFALIIGVAHVTLFIIRKTIENKKSTDYKRIKRKLEKYRKLVNYISPFVLIAMLYHFWQKGSISISIILVVLLFDRLNELLKKNK